MTPDTGEGMTDAQLADELLTFFIAGHETTAVLLTWLFVILDREPDWDARLAAEAQAALADRSATAADMARLPLTGLAIDEALRLYPPAWLTSRTAVDGDTLCGYRVDRGDVIGISPYAAHRLAAWWPDPERFDPMRFAPEQAVGRPRYAYLPFGGGGHLCIGNQFALMEARLVTASILRRFRVQRVGHGPVGIERSTTLRPAGPIPARPVPRLVSA